jgi:hypothetical protein
VSYSIYAGGAKAMQHATLADSFRDSISSPLGIGLQVLMLAALVALTKINWSNVFVNNG